MFISFEGPEGSGKTCQVGGLEGFLRQQGYPVLMIREPGGTPIGDQIRAILLDLNNTTMHPRTETLLFQASRAQIVEQVILPHLRKGGIVLADRYADSTLAYQGYGRQLDLGQLKALVAFATGGLKPDLTLLLDVDVEEGLQRRARGGGWNRLDDETLAFYQRVRQGYLEMAQSEPQRWVLVDAQKPTDEVQKSIRQIVGERLKIFPSPHLI
jgi:dTMP kinase